MKTKNIKKDDQRIERIKRISVKGDVRYQWLECMQALGKDIESEEIKKCLDENTTKGFLRGIQVCKKEQIQKRFETSRFWLICFTIACIIFGSTGGVIVGLLVMFGLWARKEGGIEDCDRKIEDCKKEEQEK